MLLEHEWPSGGIPGLEKYPLNGIFCFLCQRRIEGNGTNQLEPYRHVMRYHLRYSLYRCPLCPASSKYSGSAIATHIEEVHGGRREEVLAVPRRIFHPEIARLHKRCFGYNDRSNSPPTTDFSVESVLSRPFVPLSDDEFIDSIILLYFPPPPPNQ